MFIVTYAPVNTVSFISHHRIAKAHIWSERDLHHVTEVDARVWA